MNTKLQLRGGLNGSSVNGRNELKEALAKVNGEATRTPKKLGVLSAANAAANKGMSVREILSHIKNLAEQYSKFISEVAMPTIADYEYDIVEVGESINLQTMEDGGTREDQYREYEQYIRDLRRFCADNDPTDTLSKEISSFPGKKDMIEAMCALVRDMATIAVVEFDIANSADKEDLEDILAQTTNGIDSEEKVFRSVKTSEERSQIWAFGYAYEVVPGTFGGYYNFAVEKFAEAIRNRSRELAKDHVAQERARKEEALAPKSNRISADELFFGNPREVNGKEAVLAWKHNGKDNVIVVQRDHNRLFIIEVVGGKIAQDLDAMRDNIGGKPFILLDRILSNDGERLCKDTGTDGRIHYEFSGTTPPASFKMTCWVRTGAGHSCDASRIIGGKKTAPRLSKPLDELLTDEEFFGGWLGEYNLIFVPGFHFEDREKNEIFEVTKEASVRIERKQSANGDKIVVKSATNEETAILMIEACGAEEYGEREGIFVLLGEYEEGNRSSALPKALQIGLTLAYGRMMKAKSA